MRADLAGDPQAIAVLERAGRQALDAGALGMARQRLEAAAALAGSRAGADLLLTLAGVLLASADPQATAAICRRLLSMDELAEDERMAARRLLGRARFIGGGRGGGPVAFHQPLHTPPPPPPGAGADTPAGRGGGSG